MIMCAIRYRYFNGKNVRSVLLQPLKAMDKFRLIEEVRKFPIIWNTQIENRPLTFIADSWKEVAKSFGNNVTAEVCRRTWKGLRDAYRVSKFRTRNRLETDKQNGNYDPTKDYGCKWMYYEAMKYVDVANESQPNSNLDNGANIVTVANSDREVGKRNESNNKLQDPPALEIGRECNSPLNKNNINSNSSTPEKNSWEIHIIDDSDEEELLECQDNDQEFLSNDEDDESCEPYTQNQQNEVSYIKRKSPRRQSHLSKNSTTEQKPSDNTNETNLNLGGIDSHFLNVDIKEEPVIEIVVEKTNIPLAKRKLSENQLNSPNHHSTSKRKCTENTTLSDENVSIPLRNNNSQHSTEIFQEIGDPGYNFLISYLPHMKSLTTLQNLQFRAKLSELLLSFLTTSTSANEIKTQEINTNLKPMRDFIDPDCNFLISFWPYMKSLSELQHLQYRAKMSHLIIDIVSKEN